MGTYVLSDANVVRWAQAACFQTCFTPGAEGGDAPLDTDPKMQPGFQKPRDFHTLDPKGLTAAEPERLNFHRPDTVESVAWVATDDSAEYQDTAAWAEARYKFVPDFIRILSLRPEFFRPQPLALELLERPLSAKLTARQQTAAPALVSTLIRCQHSSCTTPRLVKSTSEETGLYLRLTANYRQREWAPVDRMILDFATKVARNAY